MSKRHVLSSCCFPNLRKMMLNVTWAPKTWPENKIFVFLMPGKNCWDSLFSVCFRCLLNTSRSLCWWWWCVWRMGRCVNASPMAQWRSPVAIWCLFILPSAPRPAAHHSHCLPLALPTGLVESLQVGLSTLYYLETAIQGFLPSKNSSHPPQPVSH